MAPSSTRTSLTLLSAFALFTLGSVWPHLAAHAGTAPRGAARKARVDAAFAVKRAKALVDMWGRDGSRSHLDEALDMLERARDTRYGKSTVLAWIGYVQIQRGEYSQALAPLREAVQSHPDSPAPYIDLAYVLDRQGQYAEAAGSLKTASTLVPRDSKEQDSFVGKHDILLRHIYLDLGGISFRAGQEPDAIQAYRQAEGLNRRVTSETTAEARSHMDTRLRDYVDEDEPRISDALGSALRSNGRYSEAVTESEKATVLRPSSGGYWRDLGEAYQSAAVHGKAGDPETVRLWDHAGAAYAKALTTFPNDSALHDLYGTALAETARYADAVKEFDQAETVRPTGVKASATAVFHYGISEWEVGNTARAVLLFQQSAEIDPTRSQILQWQGFAALKSLDPGSAIDPLKKAAQLDPNSIATHLDLGTAYIQTGQPDLALPEFQKAADLQPNSFEANYALGRTLFDLKRYPEAANAFRRADGIFSTEQASGPFPGRYFIAASLYGKGNKELTRAEIQHAVAYSLELSGDLSGAAQVHENSGGASGPSREMIQYAAWERYLLATREPTDANWAGAERALGRAAEQQPSRTILESYGDTLTNRKKIAEAAAQYARAVNVGLKEPHTVDQDPEKSVYALREKYADALRTLGRDDEAITQLETAAPRDPGAYNALVALGALYLKQARLAAAHVDAPARDSWNAKAEATYRKALDAPVPPTAPNSPNSPSKLEIRKALAPIEYSLGRYDEAATLAEAVLKDEPGNLNAAIVQYKVLYERRQDATAARMVLEQALEHATTPASGPDRLEFLMAERAVAYQYLRHLPTTDSDLHQASVYYNRALEVEPTDAESLNGKGVIAMQRRQYPEAVEQFKHAVAADPRNAAAYNNLGEAYEHLRGDHFSETLQSYRRANAENPNLTEAGLNLARYTKYARFGWESRDYLAPYDRIPVYHRSVAPPARKTRKHRRHR